MSFYKPVCLFPWGLHLGMKCLSSEGMGIQLLFSHCVFIFGIFLNFIGKLKDSTNSPHVFFFFFSFLKQLLLSYDVF